MRIGLDCRLAGPKNAGIGRYIENLAVRLPNLTSDSSLSSDSQIEWVFFFLNKKQQQLIESKLSEDCLIKSVIAPIRHYTFAEQFKLPSIFKKEKLDLLHVPHFNAPIFYSGKLVLTIHDLLWHKQTGLHMTTLKPWQYHLKYLAYRFVTRSAINKAQLIFVPAQTVKQTLSDLFPQAQDKILVTYEGYPDFFNQVGAAAKPYKKLIYVGSLYPHKNLQLVIRALKQLPQYQLEIVGSRQIFKDRLIKLSQDLGVEDQISWLGYLTDKELVERFKQSLALVQPSISEGFGLTGVEAMAASLPVIASNIKTFKEIYQQAPQYFNPQSVDQFIKAVHQLEKKSVRKKAVATGHKVAKQYSWDKMAKQTLKAYVKQVQA